MQDSEAKVKRLVEKFVREHDITKVGLSDLHCELERQCGPQNERMRRIAEENVWNVIAQTREYEEALREKRQEKRGEKTEEVRERQERSASHKRRKRQAQNADEPNEMLEQQKRKQTQENPGKEAVR